MTTSELESNEYKSGKLISMWCWILLNNLYNFRLFRINRTPNNL